MLGDIDWGFVSAVVGVVALGVTGWIYRDNQINKQLEKPASRARIKADLERRGAIFCRSYRPT